MCGIVLAKIQFDEATSARISRSSDWFGSITSSLQLLYPRPRRTVLDLQERHGAEPARQVVREGWAAGVDEQYAAHLFDRLDVGVAVDENVDAATEVMVHDRLERAIRRPLRQRRIV